jgi:signal peptidase I
VPSHVLSELWEEVVIERGASWGQVVSNSMWPAIKKGDRVLVERVLWDDLRFGDIIVFRKGETLSVHRVLAKRGAKTGGCLLEKGDAVLWWSFVPAEDVVGRVRSIQGPDRTTDVTSGYGRMLQLTLAVQSYVSLQGWRLLAFCLTRLGRTPGRRRYAGAYRRLSSLLQSITLRLAPSW